MLDDLRSRGVLALAIVIGCGGADTTLNSTSLGDGTAPETSTSTDGTTIGGSGTGTGGTTGGAEMTPEEAADLLAEAECRWMWLCDCDGGPSEFENEYSCSEMGRLINEMAYQRFLDAGLVFDAACAQQMLDEIEARGCDIAPAPACDAGCLLFHGAVPEANPCAHHNELSDCAPPYTCYSASSTCVDPCQLTRPLGMGAPCLDANNVRLGECPDGSYCEGDTRTCTPLVAMGAACMANNCVDGAWCELDMGGNGVCQPLEPDGSACASSIECVGNCRMGSCGQKPTTGETCLELVDECADGLQCYQGACASAKPSVCWS